MHEPNKAIDLQEMQIEFELGGKTVKTPAKACLRLIPNPNLVFEVSGLPQPMPDGPITLEGPTKARLDTGIEVELVPSTWFPFLSDSVLRPLYSPCTVLQTDRPLKCVRFSVLNFPEGPVGQDLQLRAGPWVIEITQAGNFTASERNLRAEGGFAITYEGILTKSNGRSFSVKKAEFILEAFQRFLSFVAGVSCSLTNILGIDFDGKEAWKQWGTSHVAPRSHSSYWFDPNVGHMLLRTWPGFWRQFNRPRAGLQLRRILAWYNLSNESDALESRIVLAGAALESLAHLVLTPIPSHQTLVNKRGYFAKKLREALKAMGIAVKIPKHCQALTKTSSRKGWKDGPKAIVEVRNDLIHPVRGYRPRSLNPYFDAWQLCQWYVELMLLKLFDYQGVYRNRLDLPMKLGKVERIP